MANRVPLDNVDHQHMRVMQRATADVSVNQALVVPSEFEQLQREYPILFRKDSDGEFQAVAVLGLDRGENLFLSEGEWTTRYVPATLRREKGHDIDAACGQLRLQTKREVEAGVV